MVSLVGHKGYLCIGTLTHEEHHFASLTNKQTAMGLSLLQWLHWLIKHILLNNFLMISGVCVPILAVLQDKADT